MKANQKLQKDSLLLIKFWILGHVISCTNSTISLLIYLELQHSTSVKPELELYKLTYSIQKFLQRTNRIK